MGRQSLRSPYPIAVRTSSVNAETTMYEERNLPRKASQGTMRMVSERNRMASLQQPDPANSSFNRELRVRASSPLLGRSYQSNQSSARHSFRPPMPMGNPQLHNPSSTAGFAHDLNFDEYSFDTRSQLSLAFGVVDDMRGIGFPQLDQDSKSSKSSKSQKNSKPPTTPKGERRAEDAPKKKPSRLDLSLLFPKPKPAAAPLLSPQRYTNSPSPVTSEFSVKPQPVKLTKPRSRGNVRASIKEAPAPIPEEPPFPRKRVSTRKPAVDWFDVPLEQIIRLGETLEVEDEEEDVQKSERVLNDPKPVKEVKYSKPIVPAPTPVQSVTKSVQPPVHADIAKASSVVDSRRSSRTPSRVSNHTPRGSRGSENHYYRQPQPPSNPTRPRTSLQTWQSEGDLRSAHQKPAGRLLKKKSSSTFHTKDLTKNSVLSLSSSEDEGENTDGDYGEQLMRKVAPSRGPRDSFSTNDYLEPEICHAEAVVATKGYGLTRLGRANSNVSSVSSDSRSTQRRPIPSRADSLSSLSRSSVSTKMYGSSAHFDVPLIEEPEEQEEEVSNTRRPRLSSQSYSDLHSAKRRSRIIAVTRQEESLLEAMRLRNGRITPSIFKDIEPTAEKAAENPRESESAALGSPEPVQTQFDTSFLRLSAAMRIPPIAAPNLAENESLIDKDSYLAYRPTSNSEHKSEHNNNNFTASPRLSLAYSETPSSSSTIGHASPVTPTLLPVHRFSHHLAAPPPSHALPPLPDEVATRRHSRRRTDSSDAIVLEEGETEKLSSPPVYPLWAVKWGRDPDDVAIAH